MICYVNIRAEAGADFWSDHFRRIIWKKEEISVTLVMRKVHTGDDFFTLNIKLQAYDKF